MKNTKESKKVQKQIACIFSKKNIIGDVYQERVQIMEEKIQVQQTGDTLFDFMLYHTYSKFAGFLTNILGAAVIFMGIIMMVQGKASMIQFLFYLVAGIAFIGYTPIMTKVRANQAVKKDPQYHGPSEYTFGTEGITVNHKEDSKTYGWDSISKVVATPKTIGFYYGEADALIVPKESFGNQFMPIMTIVTQHVSRDRIKIR